MTLVCLTVRLRAQSMASRQLCLYQYSLIQ
jgi:hypothetical protein